MNRSLLEQAHAADAECDAARTPEEMKAAIRRRKRIRSRMEFEHAMDRYEQANPVGTIADSFPFVL